MKREYKLMDTKNRKVFRANYNILEDHFVIKKSNKSILDKNNYLVCIEDDRMVSHSKFKELRLLQITADNKAAKFEKATNLIIDKTLRALNRLESDYKTEFKNISMIRSKNGWITAVSSVDSIHINK